MHPAPRSTVGLATLVCLTWVAASCSTETPPSGGSPTGSGGSAAAGTTGTGGSRAGGAGGGGSGGSSAGGSTGGSSSSAGGSGGTGGTAGGGGTAAGSGGTGAGSAGSGGSSATDASGAEAGPAPDTATPAPDAGASATPMEIPGGPKPSYAGEIPIHYGAEVGPKVEMNCPEDPTVGWTEYQDSFHIERPYNVPINTRFSIIGGIYKHWVFPNDRPHSTQAMGRNPRTEATYGGTHDKANVRPGTGVTNNIGFFTSGQRLYSADMLIESNAVGSAFMQIHTTAAGGGPIGIRMQANGDIVNNGSLTVVRGNSVPGGLVGKWFNFKAAFNADNLEVKIYVNNCLKSTYKGDRGDGNFYFKNGVYFCKNSPNGCYTSFKNIHLYKK